MKIISPAFSLSARRISPDVVKNIKSTLDSALAAEEYAIYLVLYIV